VSYASLDVDVRRVRHNGAMSDKTHNGPVDRLLGAVPFDAVIRQIDLQAILERIDLNAILDEVDIDRLVGRVDVAQLLDQVDLGQLIVESTKGVAGRALDAIRLAAARLDSVIERWVNRALRRVPAPDAPAATTAPAVRGRNAGPVSRFTAGLLDLGISSMLLSALVATVIVIADLLVGSPVTLHVPALVGIPATTLWLALYFVVSWAVPARTPGMALFGLLVSRGDGTRLGWGRALIRVSVLPFSLIAGIGLVGVVVGQRHRALQDVLADTRVVYDW
jgi:uncharacterized RDD family membrane protein YckC